MSKLSGGTPSTGFVQYRGSASKEHEAQSIVKCYHNIPAINQICKKPPNQGRRFYGSRLWKAEQSCSFFKWEEDEVGKNKLLEETVEDIVTDLENMKRTRVLDDEVDTKMLTEEIIYTVIFSPKILSCYLGFFFPSLRWQHGWIKKTHVSVADVHVSNLPSFSHPTRFWYVERLVIG